MRSELQQLCERYVTAKQTVKGQFGFESAHIYPICANVFCAKGILPDAEQLAACKKLLKAETGSFSNFRGNLLAPITCMLAAGGNPEARLAQAQEHYALLKTKFHGSPYLALTAFLLADMGSSARWEDVAARGRGIYLRMKREHPVLTSAEDSLYAVFMAFSEKSDDELIAEMEECYARLKLRFASSNNVQAASHVLCLAPGTPEAKTARMETLYDAILAAGGKYGKTYELPTLAALSILDAEIPALVTDLLDVDSFLEQQKGYGLLGMDRKTRMMHAAMLVTDEYSTRQNRAEGITFRTPAQPSPQTALGTAALAGTLAMLAAQQAAACAAISAATASASASHA